MDGAGSAPGRQEQGEEGEGDSDQEEAAPNTAFWVLRVERKYLAERLLQNNIIMLNPRKRWTHPAALLSDERRDSFPGKESQTAGNLRSSDC